MTDERPTTLSEREQLDLFPALSPDIPACDQRDLMERPFFSLAKSRRVAPIDYRAGDTVIRVDAAPDYGMATIWDADVLIWAASQIVEARERGLAPSRLFRVTPYQLLKAIGRGTGQRRASALRLVDDATARPTVWRAALAARSGLCAHQSIEHAPARQLVPVPP